jgi:hypothetical protein
MSTRLMAHCLEGLRSGPAPAAYALCMAELCRADPLAFFNAQNFSTFVFQELISALERAAAAADDATVGSLFAVLEPSRELAVHSALSMSVEADAWGFCVLLDSLALCGGLQ